MTGTPSSSSHDRSSSASVRTRRPPVKRGSWDTSTIAVAGVGERSAASSVGNSISASTSPVARPLEHVDAERRHAVAGLAQHERRQGGQHVVLLLAQVGVGQQALAAALRGSGSGSFWVNFRSVGPSSSTCRRRRSRVPRDVAVDEVAHGHGLRRVGMLGQDPAPLDLGPGVAAGAVGRPTRRVARGRALVAVVLPALRVDPAAPCRPAAESLAIRRWCHAPRRTRPGFGTGLARVVAARVGSAPSGNVVGRGLRAASEDDPRRVEVRGWLAEHPTPTGRELAEAGYVAPHWPRPWGLDADPIHQLIIDDELRRAGVRRPSNQIGIGWAGPDDRPRRHRGAEGALPLPAARGRGDLVPALQRARRRQRPRQPGHPGRARRRRVGRQRPEDLDVAGPALEVRHPHRPHRPRRRRSTRASRTSSARWTRPASRSARSSR